MHSMRESVTSSPRSDVHASCHRSLGKMAELDAWKHGMRSAHDVYDYVQREVVKTTNGQQHPRSTRDVYD